MVEAAGLNPVRWGFESLRWYALLAQLVEALALEARCSRFESEVVYGYLVIMVAPLVCTQVVGVRLP